MKKSSMMHRGFTLVELLVVIAIIGMLSAIVLASLNGARQKGRDAKRIADIKQLQLALELYFDANGAFPTALSKTALVDTGYISVIPIDPNTTAPCTLGTESSCYAYTALDNGVTNTCTKYHLGASLETNNTSALSSDSDSIPSPLTLNVCTSNAQGSSDFSGSDAAGTKCRSSDPTGAAYCYDVTP